MVFCSDVYLSVFQMNHCQIVAKTNTNENQYTIQVHYCKVNQMQLRYNVDIKTT